LGTADPARIHAGGGCASGITSGAGGTAWAFDGPAPSPPLRPRRGPWRRPPYQRKP
jgi:hypothetical protein